MRYSLGYECVGRRAEERSETGEGPLSGCTLAGRMSCRLYAKLQAKQDDNFYLLAFMINTRNII